MERADLIEDPPGCAGERGRHSRDAGSNIFNGKERQRIHSGDLKLTVLLIARSDGGCGRRKARAKRNDAQRARPFPRDYTSLVSSSHDTGQKHVKQVLRVFIRCRHGASWTPSTGLGAKGSWTLSDSRGTCASIIGSV
jgi:hypothetical protein